MTHIFDLPPEIMRLILEELYLQGYQFTNVVDVCPRWRDFVLQTVFRGRLLKWVYSENHGCLVIYKGSEETLRIRQKAGYLATRREQTRPQISHNKLISSKVMREKNGDACSQQQLYRSRIWWFWRAEKTSRCNPSPQSQSGPEVSRQQRTNGSLDLAL